MWKGGGWASGASLGAAASLGSARLRWRTHCASHAPRTPSPPPHCPPLVPPPHLPTRQAKKVQELVVAITRQFTEAYGPLILVLGAPPGGRGAAGSTATAPATGFSCCCCCVHVSRVHTPARHIRSVAPCCASLLPNRPTEDLHNFDAASFRLLSAAIGDEPLRRAVMFVVTYRCLPCAAVLGFRGAIGNRALGLLPLQPCCPMEGRCDGASARHEPAAVTHRSRSRPRPQAVRGRAVPCAAPAASGRQGTLLSARPGRLPLPAGPGAEGRGPPWRRMALPALGCDCTCNSLAVN